MPRRFGHNGMTPQEVVQFEPYHTAMTQPAHAHITDYWESLRSGRMMPLRSEVDPREMSPYLEHCFVLQHTGPGDTRFRLAGMALTELMGMELRGMPLRSIIEPAERSIFSAQLERTFETPEIQVYRLISDGPNAPRLTARLLILPVKGDDVMADRAIGCLTTDGVYGVPPRRFPIEEVIRTSLHTGQVQTSSPKPGATPTAFAGFAEAQTPFTAETEETPVPYLRVVK